MAGFVAYLEAHPGLVAFTAISAVLFGYLIYAMLNPSRF